MGLFNWFTKSECNSVTVHVGRWNIREVSTVAEFEGLIASIPMYEMSYYVDKFYGLQGREFRSYIMCDCGDLDFVDAYSIDTGKKINKRPLGREEKLGLKKDLIEQFKTRPKTLGDIFL